MKHELLFGFLSAHSMVLFILPKDARNVAFDDLLIQV